jgi:hypothetical protein
VLDHLGRRGVFGQLVDQPPGGVDQGLGRAGVVDRRADLVLQLVGGDARILALAGPGDGGALLHHQVGVALVEPADAVQAAGGAIGVVVAVLEHLGVGAGDVVRLHEGFERGLPVAVEDHPLAPLVAHLLELERPEDPGRVAQVFLERHALQVQAVARGWLSIVSPDNLSNFRSHVIRRMRRPGSLSPGAPEL